MLHHLVPTHDALHHNSTYQIDPNKSTRSIQHNIHEFWNFRSYVTWVGLGCWQMHSGPGLKSSSSPTTRCIVVQVGWAQCGPRSFHSTALCIGDICHQKFHWIQAFDVGWWRVGEGVILPVGFTTLGNREYS